MKNTLLTLFLLLAIIPATFAQGYRSRAATKLKIRLNNNMPFRVAIDGRFFTRTDNTMTIGNIPPGRHNIKVFSLDSRMGRRLVPVFNGSIRIAPYSVSNMVVDPYRHSFRITSRTIDRRVYAVDDREATSVRDRAYYDRQDNRYDDQRADDQRAANDRAADKEQYFDYKDGSDNADADDQGQSGYNDHGRNGEVNINDKNQGDYRDADDHDRDHITDNNYNNEPIADLNQRMLTSAEFNDLSARVKGRVTDSDKLKLMKSTLDNQMYSTAQVRIMIKWLGFDNSRLDFAKWAMDGVTDKKNYWHVADDFSFDASRNDFNDFIRASGF